MEKLQESGGRRGCLLLVAWLDRNVSGMFLSVEPNYQPTQISFVQ
jgi:hypothetical protein